jgi:hypothetical protein
MSDEGPEPSEAEKELEFDKQLFALAGFTLIALIALLIFFFVGVNNVTLAQDSFKREINNDIAEIQALLPSTLRIANGVVTTFINVGTTVTDSILFAIVEGTQAVMNAILAVGNTMLETIQTSAKLLNEMLNYVGSNAQQFFSAIIGPIVDFAERAGQNIILRTYLVYTIYSPILTFLAAIFRAIQRIGSIF